MRQSDLPIWVWDILIELEDQRDTHPKLLHQSGLMIRDYTQAKARKAAEMGA